jgi:hypothetical protein
MKQNNSSRWRFLIVGILLLVALLPVTTLAAPDWSACVVDESSKPVPGVLVRESYQNYSAESEGHEEDQYSDANDCVHFAPKLTRASLFRRLIEIAHSAMAGVHASFGPYDYVTAFQGNARGDDVRGGYEYAWTGSPRHVDSSLVLRSH